MPLIVKDGELLVVDGALAASEDCCCDDEPLTCAGLATCFNKDFEVVIDNMHTADSPGGTCCSEFNKTYLMSGTPSGLCCVTGSSSVTVCSEFPPGFGYNVLASVCFNESFQTVLMKVELTLTIVRVRWTSTSLSALRALCNGSAVGLTWDGTNGTPCEDIGTCTIKLT